MSAASLPAHPRSRGENQGVQVGVLAHIGSSPLTRGKPSRKLRVARRFRLIPAHAGKTGATTSCSGEQPAHPRSRGENASLGRGTPLATGSSPLTRGKRDDFARGDRARRLIPAHAGKTRRVAPARAPRSAHPRSRGENCERPFLVSRVRGSSPLTRGKLFRVPCAVAARRLIPAHAGKTLLPIPQERMTPAHPRSRGENSAPHPTTRAQSGSSPLTRGKLDLGTAGRPRRRLIPAHAGKTRHTARQSPPPSAHPRSRGENTS